MQITLNRGRKGEQNDDKQGKKKQRKDSTDDLVTELRLLLLTVVFALVASGIGVWRGTGADIGTVVLTAAIVVVTALQVLFVKFQYDIAAAQALLSRRQLEVSLAQLEVVAEEAKAVVRSADIAERALLAELSKRQRKEYESARSTQHKSQPNSDTPPEAESAPDLPQNAVEAKQASYEQNASDRNPSGRPRSMLKRIVFWEVLFTGVVATFSVAQFWTSYLQWDATNKQWEAMLEANKIYDFELRRFDPHSMMLRNSSKREGEPNSGNMESMIFLRPPRDTPQPDEPQN